jgi:hypothetical protein
VAQSKVSLNGGFRADVPNTRSRSTPVSSFPIHSLRLKFETNHPATFPQHGVGGRIRHDLQAEQGGHNRLNWADPFFSGV